MPDRATTLKCPLCEGRGELEFSELNEKLCNPALRKRLEARIAEILEGEVLAGHVASAHARNFEKEVHSWNPQLPIWRRSPKE